MLPSLSQATSHQGSALGSNGSELSTPLDEAGITLRQQHQGRFGWLAQTTHPGLAVALSILASLPAIAGYLDALHNMMYQWIQTHELDGLVLRAGDTSGFTFYSDSD